MHCINLVGNEVETCCIALVVAQPKFLVLDGCEILGSSIEPDCPAPVKE
jgi:hypothetical protein